MRKTFYGLTAAAALLAGAPALANDTSAVLGLGGIVFVKNTPVRLAAEDLYVSPEQVRVRFTFVNDTAKDVETVVAFPLPDIDTAGADAHPYGIVSRDQVNFVDFKVAVDGKPVAFKAEQRAFHKGKDVTALLNSAGAMINPYVDNGFGKLNKMATGPRNRLKAAGVAEVDADNVIPLWTVSTKFYWTQRFPAHRTVVIEHSYKPVTSVSLGSPLSDYGKGADPSAKAYADEFCLDTTMVARGPVKGFPHVTDYILKTANNWNGPIGRFHLTLDKLKPRNLLSLCWDGKLKKTGPTTFESVQTNFAPTQDIHMVVFE